jgi:hypothetical protein
VQPDLQHQDRDDIPLVAERLRHGIPLTGLDGRDIPLRDWLGRPYTAIEAALVLLASGVSGLPAGEAQAAIEAALDRATEIESTPTQDETGAREVAARITGVLVSAAIRAAVRARVGDPSPSELNRATLSWYEFNRLRGQQLLAGLDGDPGAVGRIA